MDLKKWRSLNSYPELKHKLQNNLATGVTLENGSNYNWKLLY